MKILVANLGSTSFKYRLFDMRTEQQLARGGIERIGADESPMFVELDSARTEASAPVPDHAEAVRCCLAQLTDAEHGCLESADEVAGIGFKAVHAGSLGPACRVTSAVLERMEEFSAVAPAHNPPYIAAMRQLIERLPEIPLVAAFETGFHATIPDRNGYYAIPYEWADEHEVRRWGFHGASHRYIAERTAEILGRSNLRIISCHLGGSASLCAIRDGQSMANSLGMSPQTGLPHNNRVGDFDVFALPRLMEKTGKSLAELLDSLAQESGLLGLSGVSGDVRDLEQAADDNPRAQMALDVFVGAVRQHLGAYLVELGGADAIVFTGGIGENSVTVRAAVCRELEQLGIRLDASANESASGEQAIHDSQSAVQIWIVPTNEEIIVARQCKQLLEG